ncbi:MAG: AarF/ABC1/UbiB kinase family protein [Planctomycetaceae bacterium]
MDVASLPQLARNTARFREVIGILAKYGLARWMTRVHIDWVQRMFQDSEGQPISELSTEQRIRHALTELGTTFIKLGQILSTRPDLVGPKLTAELTQLQANAPADAPDVVRNLIREELGQAPEELFSEFDETAFASASIGQVHAARLIDGTAVVLKIQHAGIEDRIRNDLEIMHRIAELAEQYSPELRQFRPVETTEEFSRTLMAELDFTREQRNLQAFLRNFAGREDVKFPTPFVELSSRRVLTMERLDGISVADCEALRKSTYDLSDIAHRGAHIFLDMIFRDGFYHADPHPGNLMLLNGGVIGLLDGGMVGRIDELLREQIEDMLLAAVRQDPVSLCDIIVRIGSLPPGLDDLRLRAEVESFLADYGSQTLSGFDLSGALNDMTGIIRRYGIVLPVRVSLLIKVLVMLEGTARNLDPDFSLAELLQPYQSTALRRRLSPQRMFNKLQRAWVDWTRLGETLPRDIADLLNQIKRGRFDVHLEHRRLEQTVNRLVMGILSAALFIGSALLWSRNVPPQLWGISIPGSVGWFFALVLGFRLVKAIRHSGNIE